MTKIDVRTYSVKPDDVFLFDNNIWMYLFASIANAKANKQRIYTDFLRRVISANATIAISSLIVSEYVNRCLRMNFGIWKDEQGDNTLDYKKDYRPTAECRNASEVVSIEIGEILSLSKRYSDDFNIIDITSLINPSEDFNDAYLIELCKRNNFIMVSDDRDIFNSNADIKLITSIRH